MTEPYPGATPVPHLRARVPLAWFVGLAAVILVAALAGELAAALVLGGSYLILTAGWALLRRRQGRFGRRGLSAVLGVGVVVLLAGGAVADPSEAPPVADRGVHPSPAPTEAPATPAPEPTPEPTPVPTSDPTSDPTAEPEATESVAQDVATGAALAAAQELEVKGRAPRTGYDRDLFGSGWVDTDRNGCDTRNDILARDLTELTYRPGTGDCVVVSGTLEDPYSGRTIAFVRGADTSNAVQIDHVVALSDAWQKGAQQWDTDTRVRFGNDPLNLLAVDGPLNMQKGDGDTATWLPPDRSARCPYVARQVAVKDGYGLWVTQAEQDAMVRVLSTCPGEPLPATAARADGAAGRGSPR